MFQVVMLYWRGQGRNDQRLFGVTSCVVLSWYSNFHWALWIRIGFKRFGAPVGAASRKGRD